MFFFVIHIYYFFSKNKITNNKKNRNFIDFHFFQVLEILILTNFIIYLHGLIKINFKYLPNDSDLINFSLFNSQIILHVILVN